MTSPHPRPPVTRPDSAWATTTFASFLRPHLFQRWREHGGPRGLRAFLVGNPFVAPTLLFGLLAAAEALTSGDLTGWEALTLLLPNLLLAVVARTEHELLGEWRDGRIAAAERPSTQPRATPV